MSEILAFTADQAARLSGLSLRQLSYWDATDFFSPGHEQFRRGAYARLYTFRDIVGLRTIALLRKKVPLQELRRVGAWLAQNHQAPWSTLTFYTLGRRVLFGSEGDLPSDSRGQRALLWALEPIARDATVEAERLRVRPAELHGRINRHRNIAHHEHVLAGTRIPTRAIRHFYEAGYSVAEINGEYPALTVLDIEAAIAFERPKNTAA